MNGYRRHHPSIVPDSELPNTPLNKHRLNFSQPFHADSNASFRSLMTAFRRDVQVQLQAADGFCFLSEEPEPFLFSIL